MDNKQVPTSLEFAFSLVAKGFMAHLRKEVPDLIEAYVQQRIAAMQVEQMAQRMAAQVEETELKDQANEANSK
jgi:septum formation topological specificity factor MinE